MVRAYDQGSHLPFRPQGGLWRRGVCLELDYRRTISLYMGTEHKKHKSQIRARARFAGKRPAAIRSPRRRAQFAGELCCQHAHADLFDDVPDAVDVVLLAHVNAYE